MPAGCRPALGTALPQQPCHRVAVAVSAELQRDGRRGRSSGRSRSSPAGPAPATAAAAGSGWVRSRAPRPSPGRAGDGLRPPALMTPLMSTAGAVVPAAGRGASLPPRDGGGRRTLEEPGAGGGISTGKPGETHGTSLALGQPKVFHVTGLSTPQRRLPRARRAGG